MRRFSLERFVLCPADKLWLDQVRGMILALWSLLHITIALRDQVRDVAGSFQDVRSALTTFGGPAMQPLRTTVEKLGGGLARFKVGDLTALGKGLEGVRGGLGVLGQRYVPGLARALPGLSRGMGRYFDLLGGVSPALGGWTGTLKKYGGALGKAATLTSHSLLGEGGDTGLIDSLQGFGDSLKQMKLGMGIALAWDVGQYIGKILNDYLPDYIKDRIGGWIARGLALLGDKEAQDAVKVRDKAENAEKGRVGWIHNDNIGLNGNSIESASISGPSVPCG